MISIIVPVYNEEDNIFKLSEYILKALKDESYEVIFINDGSTDSSEDKLMLLSVIKSSRFLKKVVPGDKLFIRVELLKFRLNNALIKGIAKVNDELVAEAEWMATVVNKNENT